MGAGSLFGWTAVWGLAFEGARLRLRFCGDAWVIRLLGGSLIGGSLIGGSPPASLLWQVGSPQWRSPPLCSGSLTGLRPMKKYRTKISYVRAQRNFGSVLFRTAHCLRGHYLITINFYQLVFCINIWLFVQFWKFF